MLWHPHHRLTFCHGLRYRRWTLIDKLAHDYWGLLYVLGMLHLPALSLRRGCRTKPDVVRHCGCVFPLPSRVISVCFPIAVVDLATRATDDDQAEEYGSYDPPAT